MNIEFSNRTVFLTGGSRGIGKRIKEIFEENNAGVIAPSREELDLSKPQSIEDYLTSHDELQPDIFIHCAGMNELAGIDEVNQDLLKNVFQVNYYSAVQLLSHFSTHMKDQSWGRIVFISSLYALVSRERRIAYSSSKNALTGLMKTVALELAPYGILSNAVAPGYVMTDMTQKNLSKQEIAELEEKIPTGKFQSEQDIASLVAFLCSEYNQSITGQLIAVDGGFTCR